MLDARPAELAAWTHARARCPAPSSSATHLVEAVELLVGERVVGLVGHREVGPHRFELAARVGRRSPWPAPAPRPGRHPTRCMPVSTLRCTPATLARPRAAARPAASMPVGRVDGERAGRSATAPATSAGRGSDSSRIGAVDARPCAAPRPPRPARRPATSRRPPSAACADRDGAVAVAVGLHHRAQLGRARRARAATRDVVRDRVEVDLGPGGAHRPAVVLGGSASTGARSARWPGRCRPGR